MTSLLEQRALRSGRGIGGSGFAKAKIAASIALKNDKLNNGGKNTSRGYEIAIGHLQDYVYSSNEKESLQAQNEIKGYEISWGELKKRESGIKRTVEQFKLEEQRAYWTYSQDADEKLLRNPLELIRTTARDLGELESEVQVSIDALEETGENAASLKGYLLDLNQRGESFRRLQGDILDGTVVPGQILKGFGYFIDADQNDAQHRIIRTAILPTSNLPGGIANGFGQIDEYSDVEGGLMSIHSRIPKERELNGNYVTYIGGAQYNGSDIALPLKRSNKSQVDFGGVGKFTINREDFGLIGTDIKPKTFMNGSVGVDEDGNVMDVYFYAGNDNKIYKLDKVTQNKLANDPGYAKDFDNARPLSPTIAKNLFSSPDVQLLNFSPLTVGAEQRAEDIRMAPQRAEEARREKLGFFGRAKEDVEKRKAEKSSFFENKNVSKKPEESVVGTSVPDIIEKGKEFFRTNSLTKPFVEGFSGR